MILFQLFYRITLDTASLRKMDPLGITVKEENECDGSPNQVH